MSRILMAVNMKFFHCRPSAVLWQQRSELFHHGRLIRRQDAIKGREMGVRETVRRKKDLPLAPVMNMNAFRFLGEIEHDEYSFISMHPLIANSAVMSL